MRREPSVNLSGDYQRITKLNKHYIKNEVYYDGMLTPELLEQVRLHLPNLTTFQLEEDRAIFISPVLMGKPLSVDAKWTSAEKIDILNSFLKIIREFEPLPLFMQLNLIRQENFYIVDGNLMHRGVLIIEDATFDERLTQSHLTKAISKFALEIIGRDINLFNFKNYFRDLQKSPYAMSIEEIINDTKEIYIKDLLVEDIFEPEEEVVVETNKVRYVNLKFASLFLAAALLITTASFAMFQAANIKDTKLTEALFKIEPRENSYLIMDESFSPYQSTISEWEWTVSKDNAVFRKFTTKNINLRLPEEGSYDVSLRVKDASGQWSHPYQETIEHGVETTNQDDLDFFNWIGAQYDSSKHMSGERSLKFDADHTTIKTEGFYIDHQIYFGFNTNADVTEPITIILRGYKDGSLIMEHQQSITLEEDRWKAQQIQWSTEEIDSLEIEFKDFSKPFWVDEISIYSSK